MRNEERNRTYVKDWLKNTSNEKLKIYFDYSQISSKNVFSVKGTNGSKPDMIIRKKIDQNYWNIAVEMKNGKSSELTKAFFQILKYKKQYDDGLAKYYIGNKLIKIHTFAICTPNSVEGYLFDKEEKLDFVKGDWIEYKEKPMSFLFWRLLYKFQQENNKTKLGIIISDKKNPILIQENKFIKINN